MTNFKRNSSRYLYDQFQIYSRVSFIILKLTVSVLHVTRRYKIKSAAPCPLKKKKIVRTLQALQHVRILQMSVLALTYLGIILSTNYHKRQKKIGEKYSNVLYRSDLTDPRITWYSNLWYIIHVKTTLVLEIPIGIYIIRNKGT